VQNAVVVVEPMSSDSVAALPTTTKILAAASRRDARLPMAPARHNPLDPSDPGDIAWCFARSGEGLPSLVLPSQAICST